jgi:type III secretion protein U
MKDETEQKSLPASDKKLRDARRKGQVSSSRDFVAGFELLALVGYLLLTWPTLRDELQALFEVLSDVANLPFAEARDRGLHAAARIMFLTTLPPAALAVVAVLVSGMAATLGPVFSFEPLQPKFDHISPAEGLKRIASLRNVVEFAKATVKVLILTAAFWLVLRGSVQSLFEMPTCGKSCLAVIAIATLKPLAMTAAIAFVVIGLLDLLVQRRLFLRDMRMTRTESKREHKDLEGDPLIRSERRRLRRMTASRRQVGMRRAVIAIAHGDAIVALRYRRGETPIPVVVAKGRGEAGARMLAEARRLGIPVVDNATLVAALAARHAIGDIIEAGLFGPVAETLVNAAIS